MPPPPPVPRDPSAPDGGRPAAPRTGGRRRAEDRPPGASGGHRPPGGEPARHRARHAPAPRRPAPVEDRPGPAPARGAAADPADGAETGPIPHPGHPGGWGDCPGQADLGATPGPAAPPAPGRGHGQGHTPGHGHGHGHGAASPAGRRVRRLLVALLVPCVLATLAGVALLWPGATPVPEIPPTQQVHGTVTAVQVADCSPGAGDRRCTGVTVALSDGPRAGRDLVQLVPNEPSTPRFAVGDPVTLSWSGANPDDAGSYQLVDFQRGAPLGWLAAAFALAVVVLGRLRGFAALVSLALSFVILLWFVLPAILSGGSPLAVAVTGACLIMFVVLYLTHGFTARTSCAVLGTLASLALIGVLGYLFTVTSRLTGLDDTTATLIGTLGPGVPVDPRGLVLAGLVIGALGALDDVTVTQASAVWELGAANPELGVRELFAAGMRIGRDHVASAVNTLVLAYAGAALPLLLLFTVAAGGVTQVLTSQDVATEIVRTLVGSVGLVAAVPVTTGLAALVVGRR
ncbi:YibE/F family protein [Pseudonocardia sp. ICBG1034]|uniref:YibE/F family protein n=1 Tax=Pseudonocardia sp. ICBG1034 TaxID=2844381 RepID=UPI001CC92A66|nr:YibE/F family protein [Pseudonocardia sp. ICBG1034]